MRGGFEEIGKVFRRHWFAKVISLSFVAFEYLEKFYLSFILDTFRADVQSQGVSHDDRSLDDLREIGVVGISEINLRSILSAVTGNV